MSVCSRRNLLKSLTLAPLSLTGLTSFLPRPIETLSTIEFTKTVNKENFAQLSAPYFDVKNLGKLLEQFYATGELVRRDVEFDRNRAHIYMVFSSNAAYEKWRQGLLKYALKNPTGLQKRSRFRKKPLSLFDHWLNPLT